MTEVCYNKTMLIIYNPQKNGSPIEGFVFNQKAVEPHKVGELKQYPEPVGYELLKIFGFLEEVTPQKAQEILAKPKEAAFKCEYCDFSTDHKVALAGHKRSHQEEIAKSKEPQLDPALVPIAETTPVEPRLTTDQIRTQAPEKRVEEGLTGSEWYGSGLTEEKFPKPKNEAI